MKRTNKNCKKSMKQLSAKTPNGVPYTYWVCEMCKVEILDTKQLHEVAQKYRTMKKHNAEYDWKRKVQKC